VVNRRLLLIIGFIPLCLCLLAAGAVVVLYQFSSEPPGEGVQAQRGYDACEPVIAALEQYYADHEDYPAALDELSPAYLEETSSMSTPQRATPWSFLTWGRG